MNTRKDRLSIIFVTLALAVVLTLLPLPPAADMLRPYWVALVLIYWCLETQDLVTLGLAFGTGLALDLLTGSLLGLHALSLVIMVYLATRFRARLRFFPPWQQALSVLGLLANDRIILIWITLLLGEPVPTWHYWLPPLVGMAIWPWLFLLMDRVRIRRRRTTANHGRPDAVSGPRNIRGLPAPWRTQGSRRFSLDALRPRRPTGHLRSMESDIRHGPTALRADL